jgi:phosphoglucosamine mutase
MVESRAPHPESRRLFGTDGIRGRVGDWPVTAEFMLKLGRAAGEVLGRDGRATVLIGKDTRVSGYMFEAALEAGLVAAGADVRLLGPMPTPAVAWLTRALGASAGIVISASHNPYLDNGIKFFSASGEKLDDASEHAIAVATAAPFVTVAAERLGKAARISDAAERYMAFCRSTVAADFSLRGLRIVLDCAHGATYQVAPRIFTALGAELSAIGVAPDGFNINAGVGTMHPEALAAAVRDAGADLGIAFDGDGDRVLMVDAGGALADGDDLLYILARDRHARAMLRGPVVGTLMSNRALETAIIALGVPFVRADVGDRHVQRALREGGGVLGGEASGHLLCLDRATTGDGLVAAPAVLEALLRSGETLAAARTRLVKLPQRTVNVSAAGGAALVAMPGVRRALASAEAALAGRGRVLLRPSGTEPLVRVTVEAPDAAEVERVATGLAAAVTSAACRSPDESPT